MVERAYEQYLVDECKNQVKHKRKLEAEAKQIHDEGERVQQLEKAYKFKLSRCTELEDLFPRRKQQERGGFYRYN